MQKEADTRIKADDMLQGAGCNFFGDEKVLVDIVLESNVRYAKKFFDELGNDFDKAKNGFIDFLLLDYKAFLCVVLEANRNLIEEFDGQIKEI